MSTLERAIEIAASAHAGQVDKAGAPHILHPLRIMLAVQSPFERMAAILYDVCKFGDTVRFVCTRHASESVTYLDYSIPSPARKSQ